MSLLSCLYTFDFDLIALTLNPSSAKQRSSLFFPPTKHNDITNRRWEQSLHPLPGRQTPVAVRISNTSTLDPVKGSEEDTVTFVVRAATGGASVDD